MGVEKKERPSRKRAALALAAALTLLAAVPAAAAVPGKAKAGEAGGTVSLLKVWKGVWGWLTAVWGEQGHGIDPNGAHAGGATGLVPDLSSGSGEQGNGIDPNGGR